MVVIRQTPSFYDSQQLSLYLARIGLSGINRQPTLDNLHAITRHHIITFPFENTDMHYTESGVMDVTPSGVFDRLVQQKRGGSHCFGQNTLLFGMLLALRYRAYVGSSRVNIAPPESSEVQFTHLSHMMLFLQLPSDIATEADGDNIPTYLVDCGFGARSLVRPILLSDGVAVKGSDSWETHRVIATIDAQSSLIPPAKNWTLEMQEGSQSPWCTLIKFGMEEYFLDDMQATSRYFSKGYDGIFRNVIAVKRIPVSEEPDADLKRLTLFRGQVTEKGGGQGDKVVLEIRDEKDRVRALNELFGIERNDDEIQYIQKEARLETTS
ncbi:N-terminal acetyltransferase [Tulasnella sp. 418]|nr:N-terminal acetyltransferase [Tulasnella sp. 418]